MSLSRHPNRREFDHLGRLFGLLADDPNIEKILVKEVEKSDILKDVECDDLSYEDWDEDGPAGGTVDPAVETTLVYELHEGGWIPKLRKVSRKFDELCDRFLSLYAAGFPKKSPSALKRESLEALDEFLGDHFWGEMPEELDGDLFTETYDEMRYECWDAAEERRDPYGYRGLSRRDFMASDRSRLIRLASTMAVGTPERKAILKGLSKRADLVGDLEAEFDSILAGHDANLDAASEFGMRSAHKLQRKYARRPGRAMADALVRIYRADMKRYGNPPRLHQAWAVRGSMTSRVAAALWKGGFVEADGMIINGTTPLNVKLTPKGAQAARDEIAAREAENARLMEEYSMTSRVGHSGRRTSVYEKKRRASTRRRG